LTTLYSILLAVDVLLAMGITGLVLIQHGKGADAGAAFGSGASATVFGARGSTSFLSRSTAILATLFFINSLTLAYLASHQPTDQSVVETLKSESPPQTPTPSPAPSGPSDVPGVDVPPTGTAAGETGDKTEASESASTTPYEDVPNGEEAESPGPSEQSSVEDSVPATKGPH
jgi:preprotein translocase subunit SecG